MLSEEVELGSVARLDGHSLKLTALFIAEKVVRGLDVAYVSRTRRLALSLVAFSRLVGLVGRCRATGARGYDSDELQRDALDADRLPAPEREEVKCQQDEVLDTRGAQRPLTCGTAASEAS